MSYLSSISGLLRRKSVSPSTILKPIDFIQERLQTLEHKLVKLIEVSEGSDYDFNEFEAQVYKLEQDINDSTDEASHTDLFWKIEELTENLNTLKKKTNFFDKEDVLDLMSPNIDDEPFDEESMSYDNTFDED